MPENTDQAAHKLFIKLILEHQNKIHAYILSLVANHTDADDILQEVCSQIWIQFSKYEPGTNFLSWALRFAFFEVINFRKRKGRSRQVLFDNEVLKQIIPILNDETKLINDRSAALEKCQKSLNERSREILRMRYDMEMDPKGISERMSIPVQNVYKLLSRIHGKLLECIEQTIRREKYLNG